MQADAAHELTAHQRAVLAKEWLDNGERLLISDIAERCGVTINGAKYMMQNISAVQPYYEIDGLWQRVPPR